MSGAGEDLRLSLVRMVGVASQGWAMQELGFHELCVTVGTRSASPTGSAEHPVQGSVASSGLRGAVKVALRSFLEPLASLWIFSNAIQKDLASATCDVSELFSDDW